ncbi:DNA modification methylase [Bradyrhizobium sp. CB1015]|uniref:DNA modification methylase n=1 Tax=Bradyrhizobium sp. CB1015 TaxID=2976822 RepID=UPI0021AAE56B|nr:DNA modification methylase [Bradyrhizobium sp. CB1015]UWU90608.1 DNA modification methylase [Bradyrhizobium sp. CB1015]
MTTAKELKRQAPDIFRELQIFSKPLDELKPPRGRDIRRHPPVQIQKLVECLQAYGPVRPIIIGRDDRVIDGWALALAAKQLGYRDFPVSDISDLSEAKQRGLRVSLNKMPEYAEWNDGELKLEIEEIFALDSNVTLGFEVGELDAMLDDGGLDQEDQLPPVDEQAAALCQVGDQFVCGNQIIQVGDALKFDNYTKLLEADRVGMTFMDPPYNVPINGHVTRSNATAHHDFPMGNGEFSSGEFQAFLETSLGHVAKLSRDGSMHYVCMDWRHQRELLAAGDSVFTELKNVCVWNKSIAGMGSLYRSQHEFIFVYKFGTAPHVNNIALGRHGRNRTNVWNYVSQSALSRTSKSKPSLHPTVKPVAMVADAIRDCSNPGDIILDPFGGAGTTMIAAEKTGRRARLLELNPRYVDVAIQRWQRLTGKTAYHAETGRPFSAGAAAAHSK